MDICTVHFDIESLKYFQSETKIFALRDLKAPSALGLIGIKLKFMLISVAGGSGFVVFIATAMATHEKNQHNLDLSRFFQLIFFMTTKTERPLIEVSWARVGFIALIIRLEAFNESPHESPHENTTTNDHHRSHSIRQLINIFKLFFFEKKSFVCFVCCH